MWACTEVPEVASVSPTSWLIFMDDLGLGAQVVTQLRGAQHEVVEVSVGRSFRRLGKQRYEIRPGDRPDYDSLLWDIRKRGNWPRKIMHFWSVSKVPSSVSLDEALEMSFFSLVNLIQAIPDHSLIESDIAIVSNSLQSVMREQIVGPARATLLGPTIVLPREFPNIVCRSIDCEGQGMAYLAVQIIAEHCSKFQDSVVAYRGKRRFVLSMEPLRLPSNRSTERLDRKGVYLITGGLGRTGLSVGTFLARNCAAKLILMDTRQVPPAERWADALLSDGTPVAEKEIIRQLMGIRELGGEIRTVRGDVAKSADMKQAIVLAVREFGKIDGAVHAARVRGTRGAKMKTREEVNRVLKPSIQGLTLLDELLRPHSPKFIVAISSAASLKSRPAHAARVAGDNFLNAYAAAANSRPVFAINCDCWSAENPTTQEKTRPYDYSAQSEAYDSNPSLIKTLQLFFSTSELPRVIVCSENAESVLPSLKRTADVHDRNGAGLEEKLCCWWQEFLDLDHVDIDDDFFDLGGHSLTGVQLLSEIKKTYELDLGLSVLFEARTVRQLAEYIRKSSDGASDVFMPWSPLVPIQPKGEHAPLFVVSGLGGNVIKFHSLAFHLGQNQPMLGLLPRGLDGNDTFHSRIEEMAADYVAAIRGAQPQGPYHIVGYSFGGIVAFEVAQQILAMHSSVALLGLFDTMEWHYLLNSRSRLAPSARLKLLYKRFQSAFGEDKGFDFLKTGLKLRFSKLMKRSATTTAGGLTPQLELIETLNISAANNYNPKIYPGTLTLFRSTQRVDDEGNDELLGWGGLAAGGVELQNINSTHFDILREPAVIELAQKLKPYLR
jgi:thioesterase domain-containing protein/acyl carrier protein